MSDHVDRLEESARHHLQHRALRRDVGRLAEEHDVANHARRRVVADVGELLHAHVGDVATERAEREGKAFGDATGVLTRSVQRDAAFDTAHAASTSAVRSFSSEREDVADRRHDVLARPQQREDLTLVGQHGRIHDRVGVDRADLVDAVRRDHAERADPRDLARVEADLGVAVHPAPDELEIGVAEDALDRFLADEAGCPLDHAIGHGQKLRPGRALTEQVVHAQGADDRVGRER